MVAALFRRLLAHPLTSGVAIDDPATTVLRKHIISSKPFLKAIYEEWYQTLASEVPAGPGGVLELGSGAGFCDEYIDGLITSEIFYCPTVQMAVDAQHMPFRDQSLRAIVLTDVLHHVPNILEFFAEASRCLRPGGKILMIEPWNIAWSKFVYQHLHHEPFYPDAQDWSFPASGPLSGANGALPWIVFVRDRARFESEFPEFSIERISPFLPFRYLISGGVGMRSLMPGFMRGPWMQFERALMPQMARLAMFAFISVRRR